MRGRQAMSGTRPQPQIGTEDTSLLLPLAIGIVLILINAYWICAGEWYPSFPESCLCLPVYCPDRQSLFSRFNSIHC